MPPLDEQVLNAFCEDLRTRFALISQHHRTAKPDGVIEQAHMLAGSAAYCQALEIERCAREVMHASDTDLRAGSLERLRDAVNNYLRAQGRPQLG